MSPPREPLAYQRRDQERAVGDDEDPVSEQEGIDHEQGGCRGLSNEKPGRNAFAFRPRLLDDLADQGQQQDPGSQPSDEVGRHLSHTIVRTVFLKRYRDACAPEVKRKHHRPRVDG